MSPTQSLELQVLSMAETGASDERHPMITPQSPEADDLEVRGRLLLQELRAGKSVSVALRRSLDSWSDLDQLMRNPEYAMQCLETQDAKLAARALRLASLADSAIEVLEQAIAGGDRFIALELLKELELVNHAASFAGPPALVPSAGAARRILLIEDEPSLRRLITRHFRRAGYEVDDAGSAEEVLLAGALVDIYSRRPALDCMLLDINLPGVSGTLLGQMVRDAWPDTPIVYMSGDPDAGEASATALRPKAPLVTKPFQLSHLEEVIEATMLKRSPDPAR